MLVIEIISITGILSMIVAIFYLRQLLQLRRNKIDKLVSDQIFFNLKISALIIDYNCNQILILLNPPTQKELGLAVKSRDIILTDFLKLMKPT